MDLQVLLVEDDPDDMRSFLRDFPSLFAELGIDAKLHAVDSFEEANRLIDDRSRRFDLILSDTYRGEQKKGDAAVIDMVNRYRGSRFCPLVVFSASAKPDELMLGAFVVWAEKAESGGIEKAIKHMLLTGIPQAARQLHDELDRLAGSYLWEFLEKRWKQLEEGGHIQSDILSRLIRRRAALQLAEMTAAEGTFAPVTSVHGLEFYMYPPINRSRYSLGEVIRSKRDRDDIRVILTPHCFLVIQPGKERPRAEFVTTIKAVGAASVLGGKKIQTVKDLADDEKQHKKLKTWATPPSGQDVGTPDGRYWYLPAFLEIPHLYCDFMQVHSLPYGQSREEYESLAVLAPPYAESLQACYGSFHGSVGIPSINPASILSLLR